MIRKNLPENEVLILSKVLDSYYPLEEVYKQMLYGQVLRMEVKKGEFLYQNDDKGAYIYFIIKGASKAFNLNSEGNQEVYWFGFEGDICFCPRNYVRNSSYNENVKLYEDSILYRVEVAGLKDLYNQHREWANWGRCMIEDVFLLMSEFSDYHRFALAKERYKTLLKEYPNITQRVPLQDIASFLGITPVSLSRIRAER